MVKLHAPELCWDTVYGHSLPECVVFAENHLVKKEGRLDEGATVVALTGVARISSLARLSLVSSPLCKLAYVTANGSFSKHARMTVAVDNA